MSKEAERATYPQKLQTIRSKGQTLRFHVCLPMPLAAAIGVKGGEEVDWELLDRRELRLVRRTPAPPEGQRSF